MGTRFIKGYSAILILSVFFVGVFAGLPQKARAADLCPAGSTFAIVGLLQTCVDGNKNVLHNPDGSVTYSFTTAQVQAAAGGGATQGVVAAGKAEGKDAHVTPGDACSLLDASNWFTNCIWNPLMAWLGSWFLTIGGAFLKLAGVLFNVLVRWVLVGFKDTVDKLAIMPAIEIGWSVFRDFSNILIIGVFTFIAISIILGIKEYGEKKMIARVLIVAVLINFSLLFTKIIIDASNFTAAVIYRQMAASDGSFDMAQAFLKPMNITSIWRTNDPNSQIQEISKGPDGGIKAFAFGLVGGILLFAAAIVLFYGCFLIAARAVLFIFLMLTSALAFATYLMPTLQKSTYGWSAWWKSLLNAALFAPLLMIFLAMSLAIMNAAGAVAKAPIGDVITAPEKALATNDGWVAIVVYIIGIGTLFLSFRLSSSLAGKIPGLNIAAAGMMSPLTLGSRFLAAPFLRQTAGWLGYRYQKNRLGEARDIRDRAGRARIQETEAVKRGDSVWARRYGAVARGLEDQAESKLKAAARGAAVAGSKMNIMDTGAAKAIAGAVGLKGIAAGASSKETKGFEGQIEERVKAAEKMASKIAPSADQNEKAKDRIREDRRAHKEQLEAIRDTTKTTEQLAQKLTAAQKEKDDGTKGQITLDEDFRAGRIPKTKYDTDMATQGERIKNANAEAQRIQNRIKTLDKPVKEWDEQTDKEAEKIVAGIREAAGNIAEKVGQKQGDILTRTLGKVTGVNKDVGKKTKDAYTKKIKTASLRDVLADIQGESGPASPPPTPPTTPAHP